LQRRKVYRVAAGYAVAGWLIIQVAVTVFPILELPIWATRPVVFGVLGGFPIALILSWAFDLGPGGIQVTPEPTAECPLAYRGRGKNVFLPGLSGLAISVAVSYSFSRTIAQRSINRSQPCSSVT
jgi:hypothetical protein